MFIAVGLSCLFVVSPCAEQPAEVLQMEENAAPDVSQKVEVQPVAEDTDIATRLLRILRQRRSGSSGRKSRWTRASCS